MYASIPDALRALARKIGADANGRNEEEILNNIVVKLGGTPIRNHGVAGSINAMTKVVDLDVMHNLTTLSVTPTTSAQSIAPESPVDGYSSVSVSAVTSAIDQNIVAGNIKKDVEILGVTGSYEGSGAETFEVILAYSEDQEHNPVFTPNKTFTETVSAIQNGKAIVLKVRYDNSGTIIDRYAACFYTWVEPEIINAIYFPFYMTSSSVNGYIWDNNGFGASAFNGTITVNP